MEDSVDKRSDLLIQEYQRAVQHMEQQFTHIRQIVGIGFTALGAVIVLMSTSGSDTKIMEWGFWGIPFILDFLVAIVIYLLLHMVFSGYYVRDIESELAREHDIPYLHFQETVARGVFSFRSGITEMKGVLTLLIIIVSSIYCSLIVSCVVGLANLDVPFWRLLAFTVLQVAITTALVWIGIGSTRSFRHVYKRWIFLDSTAADELASQHGGGPSLKTWIRYIIVPKPIDLVMKPLLTLGAAGFTMLCLRIAPSWNLALAVVLATICLEFLAKQATYIWNEILDMDKERLHPWKKENRFLLLIDDGPIGRKVGKLLFLSRALLAILMAIAIGDVWGLWFQWLPWFVAVILFVFVWQYLYERWGKSDPRRRLVMVGLGYSQRTIVGACVVMAVSNDWDLRLLVLTTAWMSVFQGMTIANLWRAESEYLSVWMRMVQIVTLANLWRAPDEYLSSWMQKLKGMSLANWGPAQKRSPSAWIHWLRGLSSANLGPTENDPLLAYGDTTPHLADQSPGWFKRHNNQVQLGLAMSLLLLGLIMAFSLTPASVAPDLSVNIVVFVVCMAIGSAFILAAYGGLMEARIVGPYWIKPVPFACRGLWLCFAMLVVAFTWVGVAWFTSAGLALAVVGAMAAPFIVTILSAGSTYDEINGFGEWLMKADKLGSWLDRKLFEPHSLNQHESSG